MCNFPIQTSFAMVHMPEVDAWSGGAPLRMNPLPEKTASQAKAKKP